MPTFTKKQLSSSKVNIARLLVWLYYKKITVVGQAELSVPTLYLCSHRNGAVDGLVMAMALKDTPSLVSVQLLRNPVLRLLFDGVAVVRQKDVERYGISKTSVLSPIDAAVAQLSLGGSLCLYPEGTSDWSYQPQPYQKGMAKIIKALQEQKITVQVQPIGLFYTKPDGLASRVSIVFGEPFCPVADDENGLYDELGCALDEVSVNCADVNEFNAVQSQAWQASQKGTDFGQAFLLAQKTAKQSDSNKNSINEKGTHQTSTKYKTLIPIKKLIAIVLMWLGFLPVMLGGYVAGRLADGRNTVTFFRLLGAIAGAAIQSVVWLMLWVFWAKGAVILGLLMIVGIVGRNFYPEVKPVDMSEC